MNSGNIYKRIPGSCSNREKLIKYISPDKSYTYWEFDDGEMDTTKSGTIIYSRGKRPPGLVIKDPKGSMFMGCLPAFCYKYIAYVYHGQVGYITSDQDFITFMGSIDNLQEAILLAETHDNIYPDTDKRGACYRVTPKGYQLILTKYNFCPESKRAIKIIIESKGITKKFQGKFFYKSKNCVEILLY